MLREEKWLPQSHLQETAGGASVKFCLVIGLMTLIPDLLERKG